MNSTGANQICLSWPLPTLLVRTLPGRLASAKSHASCLQRGLQSTDSYERMTHRTAQHTQHTAKKKGAKNGHSACWAAQQSLPRTRFEESLSNNAFFSGLLHHSATYLPFSPRPFLLPSLAHSSHSLSSTSPTLPTTTSFLKGSLYALPWLHTISSTAQSFSST